MKNKKIGFQILKDVKLSRFMENKNEKQKNTFSNSKRRKTFLFYKK